MQHPPVGLSRRQFLISTACAIQPFAGRAAAENDEPNFSDALPWAEYVWFEDILGYRSQNGIVGHHCLWIGMNLHSMWLTSKVSALSAHGNTALTIERAYIYQSSNTESRMSNSCNLAPIHLQMSGMSIVRRIDHPIHYNSKWEMRECHNNYLHKREAILQLSELVD